MQHHFHPFKLSLLGAVGLSLLIASCEKSGDKSADDPDPAPVVTSFDQLQRRILTPTCAVSGCHSSETDPTFAQHKLVLAADVAYKNLVGVASTNATAKANGLLRVKPFAALESLLYHKINAAASHHSGANYGNPMPLGKELLTVGQIEFVRRWIEAGAPREGSVVDSTLLDDKTPSTPAAEAFEGLKVPAATEGFQLKLDPFTIIPNFERELFMRKSIGNTQDVYVNRFEVKMRNNSHHFVMYNFRNNQNLPALNQIRDLRNSDNSYNLLTALSMQNHVYFIGIQAPYIDYAFPEGTALLIPANTTMDFNSHYVNKSNTSITGEVFVNLYTTDKAKVKNVVKTMDFTNNDLSIPANKRVTLSKTFLMTKPVKVLVLTSHTHKLAEKFVIKIKGGARDGEVIYTSTNWEHPEIKTFTTPILLAKGEGLISEITYNNTTAKDVSFGLTSEDEMGIIFGYYLED
ncbi:monooxygenase [Larkinella sp. GY13]|uniref:monooxygenase n=1 Tax=Larkinella sp. GY13 TaxID=3453720 RepID=UPI003EEF400B